MPDLKNEKRAGFYFKEGTPYLSTTEILKVIAKPALMYWFGREVFYAMVKDPSLDEKRALAAPYATSDKAKNRGSTVDSITQMLEEKDVAPEFQGYANAYRQFIADHKPVLIDQQRSLFDNVNHTAGTLDKYWKIGDHFHLTDIKTGKDIYPEVDLQLSNYASMLRADGSPVDEISVLLLEVGEDGKSTGKYKFETRRENYNAFLSTKNLYEWVNREKLIKLGYLT